VRVCELLDERTIMRVGYVLLVAVALAYVACKSPPRLDETEDAPLMDRRQAKVVDVTPDARVFEETEEQDRREREGRRREVLALPPTATPGPASSVFGLRECPPRYGLVWDDAGDYCGKLCDQYYLRGMCDEDDAGDASSCCGRHRCNRRVAQQVPWAQADGPMPGACSRDETPAPRAKPRPTPAKK
jgi:hypothetical protein